MVPLMKLVVLDSYACTSEDLSFDRFAQLAELTVYPRSLPQEVAQRIGDAQLLITNKCIIDEAVLRHCPNLKYIGVTATGYNIIDLAACEKRGIVVTNVPAYSTKAVAQHVFASILYFSNQVAQHDKRVKAGEWQNCQYFCFYEPGLMELDGKTIGLVGFGNIAKRVAALAHAFDMKVMVYTRTVRQEDQEAFPYVEFASLEALLQRSDFVSLHCPLTPQTQGLLNRERIGQMKETAVLINTARGPIVEEQALAEALNEGRLRGACCDVVSAEPIQGDNPLLSAKNILLTPHIAWAPRETRQRLLDIVYDNLDSFLKGTPKNQVTQ